MDLLWLFDPLLGLDKGLKGFTGGKYADSGGSSIMDNYAANNLNGLHSPGSPPHDDPPDDPE